MRERGGGLEEEEVDVSVEFEGVVPGVFGVTTGGGAEGETTLSMIA